MSTVPIKQPRRIDPSLVEIGDDVSVEYKMENGIIKTLRGIVGKRVDTGKTRYLLTKEGATLYSWSPERKAQITITLYGRAEQPQTTLFEIDEIRERIAS